MELWIIGKVFPGHDDGKCDAIFLTEGEAVAACEPGEFVALVEVGQRFPDKAADAKRLYFPPETWEQSKLYAMRAESAQPEVMP